MRGVVSFFSFLEEGRMGQVGGGGGGEGQGEAVSERTMEKRLFLEISPHTKTKK